ncbi:aminoglycoside phosphotransferase family protein [Nodosilinea sp. LEGE 06152]|uniref:aminoglycoside phosphotransferase family protein n=1 Tax=Nodosilinea sp. LEGE 06152 TaxID=2777966 RepID=UPI00187F60D4|nr:aminoglycoside phosphotransferase family protein [Nodosilinea sp. LEGE 06152]MBE9159193.1 aminoglycoside phosphotransferase family protein [Nodosilinea sp. LEGE 06152]
MPPQNPGRLAQTPDAEVVIDVALVRRLLQAQHPDLAHLPITPLDAGWDNVMFRLGNFRVDTCFESDAVAGMPQAISCVDCLVVRLPRRQIAAALIDHEQIWLPRLAAQLPIAVPVPYRVGAPACGYPWRWSVLPWLSGCPADLEPPHPDQANRFGEILRALHTPAPANAPRNSFRGVPLKDRAAAIAERLARLETKTDLITPTLKTLWQSALIAPIDTPATWLHGDLHPRNILVEDGLLTGIIDWGDITSGDRATDLAAVWMLFEDGIARREAIAAYGSISEATLRRAQGWAIFFGVVLLDTGLVDHPRHAAIGEQTLRRIAAVGDSGI